MKNYITFLKKEIIESVRTYKILIILIVYFVFGMLSPLTAKLLPEILSSIMTEGISINIPEPSAIDSWGQFFKNISQVGLFLLVILFSGVLVTEISKGTLINLLTKGLKRSTVVLSKLISVVLIWTVSYLLAFFTAYGYTAYLFPGGAISNLPLAVFCLWLFGVFLIFLIVFSSTFTKSYFGPMLITGGTVCVLALVNIIPGARKFNPYTLTSENMSLITSKAEPSVMLYSAVTAAVCMAILIASSLIIFRKRQI